VRDLDFGEGLFRSDIGWLGFYMELRGRNSGVD
jgi:hypothetical protein